MPSIDELFNPLARFSHFCFVVVAFVATIRQLPVCCHQVPLSITLHQQSLAPVQSTVPGQEKCDFPTCFAWILTILILQTG
jgi:hypothetical protein